MDFLGTPIGFVMNFLYEMFNNYGITIVVISVIFKCIILPLTIKQQKSMVAMQQIQPLVNEVQKKYANDKEDRNDSEAL